MNTTRAFVAALSAAAVSLSAQADSVSITKVGEYDIDVEGCGGITYAGGNSYYILKDHLEPTTAGKSTVYQLTINAGSDGSVSSSVVGDPVVLDGNGDSEGIAYDPAESLLDRNPLGHRKDRLPHAHYTLGLSL